ncbi:MAG: hypothetical protein WA738_12460 [Candidatus Angelobacter sp.]
MSFKPVIAFIALLSVVTLGPSQQTPTATSQAGSSQGNLANAAENAQIKRLAGDDARSIQEDLRRMRALVQQMETNLAFIDTTQSPLKHQFQLDIDMWKILIAQMERKTQGNAR